MRSIGWLHISDLHATVRRSLWSDRGIRGQFFQDLKELHKDAGPWDLIIVSGDLTMRGAAEEFERVDEILEELCDALRSLSPDCDPCVLAVPGNHDVRRVSDPSPEAMRSLRRWHEDPAVQNEFWTDPDSPARRFVDRALEPYARWWSRRAFPAHVRVHDGLLPGDFTATIEKDGIRLGVAGMCSTFLQVTSDDYEERLAVEPLQLTIAARGDVPAWIAEHDAALLVTHHPRNWLAGASRRAYEEVIYPKGRFCAHLSGHVHGESLAAPTTGDVHEDPTEALSWPLELRAPSCLGLSEWETWRGDRKARHHGYNACRFLVDGTEARLEIWRRTWRGDSILPEPTQQISRVDRLFVRSTNQSPPLNGVATEHVLECAALRDEFYELYPSTDKARGFAQHLNRKLLPGGSGVDVWHAVVRHAKHQQLKDLVGTALKDHPDAISIHKAWNRFQAVPSATSNGRGLRIDDLADDLQERLHLLPPAALSAVLHMSSLPELGPLENAARAANAIVREAIKRGPNALARLAAATTLISGLLSPSDATGRKISALEALDLGDRALVDGQISLARKRTVLRSPTPETLVKLLSDMFSDLRDFDGFVLEHFPAVYRRFTNGMSRESRALSLVREVDPITIMACLKRDHPSAFASHQRVLDYITREDQVVPSRSPSRFF